MTIKSFKEHAEINENPIGGLAALGYGAYKTYKVAKKVAPVAMMMLFPSATLTT